ARDSGIRELFLRSKGAKLSLKFSSESYLQFSQQEVNQEVLQEEPTKPEKVEKVTVRSAYVGILRLNDKKGNPVSSVGKTVSKGEVLCNIEVLGILHEVTSPCSGRIDSIFLNDGDIVEYGSTLMEIVPDV
ncbi:MAG: biotin/lipoyl-containing protein, partial [Brevinematia bacterium]